MQALPTFDEFKPPKHFWYQRNEVPNGHHDKTYHLDFAPVGEPRRVKTDPSGLVTCSGGVITINNLGHGNPRARHALEHHFGRQVYTQLTSQLTGKRFVDINGVECPKWALGAKVLLIDNRFGVVKRMDVTGHSYRKEGKPITYYAPTAFPSGGEDFKWTRPNMQRARQRAEELREVINYCITFAVMREAADYAPKLAIKYFQDGRTDIPDPNTEYMTAIALGLSTLKRKDRIPKELIEATSDVYTSPHLYMKEK